MDIYMDHRYVDIQTDLNLTKFEVSMSKWKPGCQTVLPSGHLPTVGVLAGHQCFTPKNQEIDHKINQKRWDVDTFSTYVNHQNGWSWMAIFRSGPISVYPNGVDSVRSRRRDLGRRYHRSLQAFDSKLQKRRKHLDWWCTNRCMFFTSPL